MKRSARVCFILLLLALLASCGGQEHTHVFGDTWRSDRNKHWRQCSICANSSDSADHSWGEPSVEVSPSELTDGMRKTACTVCGYEKTELIPYEGMSREEWQACLEPSLYRNMTVTEVALLRADGVAMTMTVIEYFAEGAYKTETRISDYSEETVVTDSTEAQSIWERFVVDLAGLATYENYTYDPQARAYVAKEPFWDDRLLAYYDNVTFTFRDGRIATCSCTGPLEQDGIMMQMTLTCTFGSFGTTAID